MSRRTSRASQRRDEPHKLDQTPWRRFRNPYPAIEVLDPDQLDAIHDNSMRILSEIGIKVLDARSRSYLAAVGCEVDESSEMVRFDPGMVVEMVAHAPAKVNLHARNAAYDLTLGGDEIIFSGVMAPPFANDLDRGRRAGTYDEMCEFVKLVHSINAVHQVGGGGFEPLNLPTRPGIWMSVTPTQP